MPIRMLGDPVLRERARIVEEFDAALARLADDMLETMYEAPGVGLAAPQVGVSLQLFVFDDGSGPRRLANPQLHEVQGEQQEEEGCLSIPGLFLPVTRALRLLARGLDVDGTPVEIEAEGFLARILQHETDHVNGLLFIDRLSEEHRKEAMRLIRQQEMGAAGAGARPSNAL